MSQLKIGTGPQLMTREGFKKRRVEHFENVSNRDKVTGNDIKNNG